MPLSLLYQGHRYSPSLQYNYYQYYFKRDWEQFVTIKQEQYSIANIIFIVIIIVIVVNIIIIIIIIIIIDIAFNNDEVISDIADVTKYNLVYILFTLNNDDNKLKKAEAIIKNLQRKTIYLGGRLNIISRELGRYTEIVITIVIYQYKDKDGNIST